MKTLLLLAKGFEIMEFSVFADVLGWGRIKYDYNTQTVTSGFREQIISAVGVPVVVDVLLKDLNIEDYDALAIPGGFEECDYYEDAYHEDFLNIIREFNSKNKPIASACVGALPIGKSGILTGKTATTYHLGGGYRQEQLKAFGVNIGKNPVEVEGNIMTSNGPSTAIQVAFLLLERLTSKENMETVKQAMGY